MRLKYKKPVALAITLIFALNSALFAAPELIFNNHPASRFSSAWAQKHIEIPESLGRINDSYFPDKSSPLIVHIRDAHGSYEAQKNIEKIIRYLNQNHGFNLLFLEGAASRLNPGIFNYGGNSEVNLKAADLLMRRGEFSGAENFLLKNPHQAAAFGIENVQDYRNSLRLYRSILNKLKESQKMIDDLEKDLDTKISRQASKPLQKFIRQWNQYKKGKSSLLSFSETILRSTEKYLNMDLTNAAIQFKYPNLLRVLKLKALESQLDLKKAAEEQMAISEQLDSPLNERVRNLETEKFPRYLLEQIKIDYKKYPEFTRLARYRIYKSEIDGISLHQELQSVIDQLLMKFAEKSAEKDLVHQIRLTDLLEKALKGELTREEFLTLRNQKVSAGASEQNIKNALSFYHSALRREASFLDKTIRGMAENKKSKAIIVAGGFHSEGIK